ncbi:MAG: glycosyltransferase family 4 protein [Acidobacteria bacterium]|nr:glycosyltransferase family 4 protein [Acidobacteriota bacterium]
MMNAAMMNEEKASAFNSSLRHSSLIVCLDAVRILHINSARTLGGGERHLIDLARGLSERGHEVHIALAPGSPLRAELSALSTQNIHALPLRNALDVASAASLARLLREKGMQIVHAHVARDYPLAALAARRSPDVRLVITRHVLFPLSRVHRFTLSNVSRVIAVSEAVASALRAQKIFPSRKIRIVANAIDVHSFERAPRAADRESLRRDLRTHAKYVVGIVGELSPLKGQDSWDTAKTWRGFFPPSMFSSPRRVRKHSASR